MEANQSSELLGPFVIPDTYEIEPELQMQTPRVIPPEFREGRFERTRKRTFHVTLIAGGICYLLGFIPALHQAGDYFIPLAYMKWIGVGLIALAGLILLSRFITSGPYRYYINGLTLPVRITDIVLAPTMKVNGQPSAFAFHTSVQCRHPETNELVELVTRSRDFGSVRKDIYACSLKKGDYVTGLYLPGKFPKSLCLYCFLELNPKLNVIIKRKPPKESGKTILALTVLILFFASLLWSAVATEIYEPINLEFQQLWIPMSLGGTLLGGALIYFFLWNDRNERKKIQARNLEAVEKGEAVEIIHQTIGFHGVKSSLFTLFLICGMILLGALVTYSLAITGNAWFDQSEPKPVPIKLDSTGIETWSVGLRLYKVTYYPENSEEKKTLTVSRATFDRIKVEYAVLEVKQGAFGWPWIQELKPIDLLQPHP